jgi:hypothetical protein
VTVDPLRAGVVSVLSAWSHDTECAQTFGAPCDCWQADLRRALAAAPPSTGDPDDGAVRALAMATEERDAVNERCAFLLKQARDQSNTIAQLKADLRAIDPACCCGQTTARLIVCPVHKVTR